MDDFPREWSRTVQYNGGRMFFARSGDTNKADGYSVNTESMEEEKLNFSEDSIWTCSL